MNKAQLQVQAETRTGIQIGVVAYFDEHRNHGAIAPTGDDLKNKSRHTFFHGNDEALVTLKEDGAPAFMPRLERNERFPKRGDLILYFPGENDRGIKADPWVFAQEFDQVMLGNPDMTFYRLVGHIAYPDGRHHFRTFWQGIDFETLFAKYPACKTDLSMLAQYVPGDGISIDQIRIEELRRRGNPENPRDWNLYRPPVVPVETKPADMTLTAQYIRGRDGGHYIVRLESPTTRGGFQTMDFPQRFVSLLRNRIQAPAEGEGMWNVHQNGSYLHLRHKAAGANDLTGFTPDESGCKRIINDIILETQAGNVATFNVVSVVVNS